MIRTLLTLVLLVGLGACGDQGGDDEVNAEDSTAALEQQRIDVRETARGLLVAAEKALSGSTRNSSGGYRGCESTFNDEFRSFQYLAQARVDAPHGSAASYLQKLGPALEQTGFIVEEPREEPNGFTTLAAAKGDLSASFVHTGGPFVGLDVSGPCIDVPEDQRDTWLRKDEPTPGLM